MEDLSPMLRQYFENKERYPDALLFFRMGDFYELFFDDAHTVSRAIGITLTHRGKLNDEPIPMAGVPHHAAQGHIGKLIEKGYKVAICDQVEDARLAKGLVKREVTQVVTPGLVFDNATLDSKTNNFLLALTRRRQTWGIAYLDVSTGDFYTAEPRELSSMQNELARVEPRELLIPKALQNDAEVQALIQDVGCLENFLDDDVFELEQARALLLESFDIKSLDGFGLADFTAGISAAGAVLHYLQTTRPGGGIPLDRLIPYQPQDYLVLDEATKRNLELFRTLQEGKKTGSLLHLLDETTTAMGGRTLRRWLSFPLIDAAAINQRLDEVEALNGHESLRKTLRDALGQVADLERLNSKVLSRSANARDLTSLRLSLEQLPTLSQALVEARREAGWTSLARFVDLDPCQEAVQAIANAIADDPPTTLKEGGLIRPGYRADLDELVMLCREGKGYIARLETEERARTGISSLKIRYTANMGYYIEVTRSNIQNVPAHYTRKQTLTNAERYITPELKEYESKVLGAEERRVELEYELFADVRERVALLHQRIKAVAILLAELDALCSLAEVAQRYHYVRPQVDARDVLEIEDGRHPVVERATGREKFVTNDIRLDTQERQLLILTGPNMAGKSTIMRQVALINLMAQLGSFVPARRCRVGVVDRIFTRVGASDNLAKGQSTFMVEMTETANILHFATARSLVILDEIGRGTSTFDGISIAWAVAESLHDRIGCKTLFATHYHELVDLALTRPRVKNYSISVTEWGDKIIFVRKLKEGAGNRSYGIQVARLAGLPKDVVARAREILGNLERGELNELGEPRLARKKGSTQRSGGQLSLFSAPPNRVQEELLKLDVNQLTPLEALSRLASLQALAREGS